MSAQELHKPQTVDPASIVSTSCFDVVTAQEYPDLDNVDAVLLTGSKYDSFADNPWILKLVEFTKKALAHPSVRLLGVCFGHQIIARAMGYEVGRNSAGWEVSVCEVDLTEKGKELFGVETLVGFSLFFSPSWCQYVLMRAENPRNAPRYRLYLP